MLSVFPAGFVKAFPAIAGLAWSLILAAPLHAADGPAGAPVPPPPPAPAVVKVSSEQIAAFRYSLEKITR